jgi:membrane protein implicated in regulation of membrane protease activity
MHIDTIYWILFLLGLGYAVIGFALSGIGDIGGGHDLDLGGGGHMDMGSAHTDISAAHGDMGDVYHGHGEVALNPVSPMTIAAFIGGFGGGGLIGYSLGWPSWGSILLAMPIGFVLAFGIYYFMMVINRTNVSSEARVSEMVGITAEIITPIVEEATGEIAYISRGSRYNAPARSVDGKSIAKGRPVKIWRMVGSTCYVKEIPPEEAEHPAVDTGDRTEEA